MDETAKDLFKKEVGEYLLKWLYEDYNDDAKNQIGSEVLKISKAHFPSDKGHMMVKVFYVENTLVVTCTFYDPTGKIVFEENFTIGPENEKNKKESVWKGFMEKYPILFKQKDLPMNRTCMCWGIECPEGWHDTVKDVCDKIEAVNNTVGKVHGFEIQAVQVKEKFGTLRFYLGAYPTGDLTDDELALMRLFEEICEDVVIRAEYLTESICQVCGRPIYEGNKVVSRGWIGYYCPECAEKKGVVPLEDIPKEPKPLEESETKKEDGNKAQ